jgi:hypothetical protein
MNPLLFTRCFFCAMPKRDHAWCVSAALQGVEDAVAFFLGFNAGAPHPAGFVEPWSPFFRGLSDLARRRVFRSTAP